MENKYITAIIIAAVTILMGLALWPAMAGNIGTMTRTGTSTNVAFAIGTGTAAKTLTPCYQKAMTTSLEYGNASGGAIATGNYTITQNTGTDGYLEAKITLTNTSSLGATVNVTCTYEPKGYVESGGGRAIVGLIAIFMALLIMLAAVPDLRELIGLGGG